MGIGIFLFLEQRKGEKTIELTPPQPFIIKTEEVGYGWSTKDITQEAIEEAVMMMKAKLKNKNPQYIFVWYTIAYDPKEIKKNHSKTFRR